MVTKPLQHVLPVPEHSMTERLGPLLMDEAETRLVAATDIETKDQGPVITEVVKDARAYVRRWDEKDKEEVEIESRVSSWQSVEDKFKQLAEERKEKAERWRKLEAEAKADQEATRRSAEKAILDAEKAIFKVVEVPPAVQSNKSILKPGGHVGTVRYMVGEKGPEEICAVCESVGKQHYGASRSLWCEGL